MSGFFLKVPYQPRPHAPPQQPPAHPPEGALDFDGAIDTANDDIIFSIFFEPHDGHSGLSLEENTRCSDVFPQSLHLYS